MKVEGKRIIIILVIIISILITAPVVVNFINFIDISIKDRKLQARMHIIKEGMEIEEVIRILGQPKITYEISAKEIGDRWPFKNKYDKGELEQIKNMYEKLDLYIFFNTPLIKTRNWLVGYIDIYVYIDQASRKVVFATLINAR